MSLLLDYEKLSSLPMMCTIAVCLAIGWGIVLEVSKKRICDYLPHTSWWKFALEPMKGMMINFGYPKRPTEKFPNAITDSMACDSYTFLVTLCFQHFVSALPMIPVLVCGWDDASDTVKSLFILGTLSDVGFDIYDSCKSTFRAFANHPNPLPLDFWIILVAMHHSTALSLVLPMNQKYIHRTEYHQTAVSLLMAASLCYGAGKFCHLLQL